MVYASTLQTMRPRAGDAHCQCWVCILALPPAHKDNARAGSNSVSPYGPSFAFTALPQITATVYSLLGHVNEITDRSGVSISLFSGATPELQASGSHPLLPHIFYKKNCFWTHSSPSRLTQGSFSLPEISIFIFSEMALS